MISRLECSDRIGSEICAYPDVGLCVPGDYATTVDISSPVKVFVPNHIRDNDEMLSHCIQEAHAMGRAMGPEVPLEPLEPPEPEKPSVLSHYYNKALKRANSK